MAAPVGLASVRGGPRMMRGAEGARLKQSVVCQPESRPSGSAA